MTESRKLAAILAADVVGFSRLVGAEEDRTLARLLPCEATWSIRQSPSTTDAS
jgi:hypothetical protein